MGTLYLCKNPPSGKPYEIQPNGFPVYSLEELCYYMEQNYDMLDRRVLNGNLVLWLREDAGLPALAAELENSLYKHHSLYPSALLLFEASGLYTKEELANLRRLFDEINGKTRLECRKMRADRYLEAGKYRTAMREYDDLLSKKNRGKMTDEMAGAICHNRGVAYARMFLFPEAAECFREAFRECPNPESRREYYYALQFIPDGGDAEPEDLPLTPEERKEIRTCCQAAKRTLAGTKEERRVEQIRSLPDAEFRKERKKLLENWEKQYTEMVN